VTADRGVREVTALPSSEDAKLTHGVASARRALQMLLSFTPEEPRHAPAELARRLGLPMGSIYRYVSLFRELGIIEDDPSSQLQLTPRILPVARAAMAVQNAVAIAMPYLLSLGADVGETVMLTRQTGNVAVCMASIPSVRPLRLEHPVGHTIPFGAGATTKMLLAIIPEPERSVLIAGLPDHHKPGSLDLARIAEQGWAVSDQEIDEGIWACAAGLDLDGQAPMTVTVAAPRFRLDDTGRSRIIKRTAAAAASIKKEWLDGPGRDASDEAETTR
jgi:DNA-binding IclR family transcriptional regulator